MTERQIRARGVHDSRVLDAMLSVRRHEFVDPHFSELAYDDGPLSIGEGQTISQPYIVAWMSELLQVGPGQDVLEIGTGCGYQTAVLCRLARHVYTVERVAHLAETARRNLERDGATNWSLHVGDGRAGWPEHAPYPRILTAAAPEAVPPALIEQLAPGGRMVLPVGPRSYQWMTLVTKGERGEVGEKQLSPVAFVPLLHGSA